MPRSATGPLQRMPSIPNFDGSSNKQIGSKITCLSMEISMLIFGLPWAKKPPDGALQAIQRDQRSSSSNSSRCLLR